MVMSVGVQSGMMLISSRTLFSQCFRAAGWCGVMGNPGVCFLAWLPLVKLCRNESTGLFRMLGRRTQNIKRGQIIMTVLEV